MEANNSNINHVYLYFTNYSIFDANMRKRRTKREIKVFFVFVDEYSGSLVHWSIIYCVASSKYHTVENSRIISLPLGINRVGYHYRGRASWGFV